MFGWLSDEAMRASRSKRSISLRPRGQAFGQELQRDVPAQPRVLGLVDHAHAAGAELTQDAVVLNQFADHLTGL